ncbi:hypothetical protein HNQ52_002858 [Chiayiivirga flava]|uniref:DUF11 domain-containing protein n=2 Tax=Chiayiivirga flava TaxID=659595 RepID=A0A7W8D9K8_9GAMM|nr:hypothetical protein [Chiayiivirga flava]
MDRNTRAGAIALAACLAASGSVQAGVTPRLEVQMGPPPTLDSGTFGANGENGIGFTFTLLNASELDDLTAQGPFTLRVELPPGVSYAGMNGGLWTCVAAGQSVECSYPADLTYWNWGSSGMSVHIDTAPGIPIPGAGLVRATLESAEVPLPDPVVCEDVPVYNMATSDTGCVERSIPHRRSQVEFSQAFWSHWTQPFTAGGQGSINMGFRNTGYGQNNGPVVVDVQLPPGITRYGGGGSPPFDCVNEAPDAQGQRVRCTTAYFYDGQDQQTAGLQFLVDIADDIAIPGPHPVVATVHNAQQPARDLSTCVDTPMPVGCGYYGAIQTQAMPQPKLEFLSVQHLPGAAVHRLTETTVQPSFANAGDGSAGAMTLRVSAPAGFAYDRATASPPATCSASGSAAAGQTVICEYPQGLPPSVTGYSGVANLVFDVLADAPAEGRFVFAIGDTLQPGPSLAACVANAQQDGCIEYFVPVSPWLFCDGFEDLPHACGERQRVQ